MKLAVLLLLSFLGAVFGLPYSKDSGVIALTKANFAEQVFGSEHVWIVEFYAPWCGHCKQLAPEWEKLAKNLKGIVKVAAVNGDEERELAGAYEIKGFPTIKVFPAKLQKTPDGKGVHKVPEDYQGARTASAMATYVLGKLPNFVTKVTSKSVEEFLSSPADLAKAILFTNKKDTTPLYKALAVDFHHQLVLGEVRDTEKEVVASFGVTKFPTLVLTTAAGERLTYEGELKHEALFSFLKPHAKELAGKNKKTEPKKEVPVVEPVRPVREQVVDQQTFESVCFNKNANCLIALLDPQNTDAEEQERYVKVLENVQDKYSKAFNLIWIDAVAQPDFVDTWNMASGYPAMVAFNHKKSSIVPYIGAFSEESITDFLEKILRGTKRASPVTKIPSIVSKKDEL